MTSRLSQIPGGTVQFSLSASQAVPVISSVLLSYCFAYKMQIYSDDRLGSSLPSSKTCFFFEAFDSIFGCRYLVTISCTKIRVQQQESTRVSGLPIPCEGLLGPHSAAWSHFRLFKIVFSCNILQRAFLAAWACQSSQMV